MITIKTDKELKIMQQSGAIAATVMEKVIDGVKPGISKAELDKIAGAEIKKLGGQSSFTTVPNYNFPTCITVNSEVVHGIPNDYILKNGDLVSLDLGVILKGLHTDCARTVFLGKPGLEVAKFILIGEKALNLAVKEAKLGNYVRNISSVIQKTIEGENYSVVRALVGHGVGRKLHEDPQVPGFVTANLGAELKIGMTIAIEVIYTKGGAAVILKDDGWTVTTKDRSLAGLFEDTVAITKKGPVVLTSRN